jgi:Uma2 family endonuclease
MGVWIRDSLLSDRLIAERRATGADRYDEVWDGEYVMSPMANNEHQQLAGVLTAIFTQIVGVGEGIWCQPGANVSDQETAWTTNFRCPDVVVVLPGCHAVNRDTHWFGGPDLVVEIVSEGDASYEKFEFYSKIAVREALIIDRDPWSLEMYRLNEAGELALVGRSDLEQAGSVQSEVIGAELRLIKRKPRPRIEVNELKTGRIWHT